MATTPTAAWAALPRCRLAREALRAPQQREPAHALQQALETEDEHAAASPLDWASTAAARMRSGPPPTDHRPTALRTLRRAFRRPPIDAPDERLTRLEPPLARLGLESLRPLMGRPYASSLASHATRTYGYAQRG